MSRLSVLTATAITAGIFAAGYLLTAFVVWQLNPATWTETTRLCMVWLSATASFCALGALAVFV